MGAEITHDNIVEVADNLFYEQGFAYTSFADIAKNVNISRGNFYYHFKTKDDILDAVIEKRLVDRENLLNNWALTEHDPQKRIESFIKILSMNREKIKRYGCPIGTLCNEMARLGHSARDDATRLFELFHIWLSRQFTELGFGESANKLAMHLLARSQGVATMANAFGDDAFINREILLMCDWLEDCIQHKTED